MIELMGGMYEAGYVVVIAAGAAEEVDVEPETVAEELVDEAEEIEEDTEPVDEGTGVEDTLDETLEDV